MANSQQRRKLRRYLESHTMPQPIPMPTANHKTKRNESDRLALALFSLGGAVAIAAVLVALFLDKWGVLVGLIVAFYASLIYPIHHFFKVKKRRTMVLLIT